jgi:hypothetical protein
MSNETKVSPHYSVLNLMRKPWTVSAFCNSHERITVQVPQPPVARKSEAKRSRFGTENLFSNQSTKKGTFVTDNMYFTP